MATIMRWDPRGGLGRIPRHLDFWGPRFDAFQGWPNRCSTFGLPVDVHETSERLVVQAAMPGLQPEDFDLMVEDNILTISCETKSDIFGEGRVPICIGSVCLVPSSDPYSCPRASTRPLGELLRGRRADRHLPPQGGDAPQATEDRGGQGRQRRRCQLVAAPSTEVNERGLWHAGGLFFCW